MSRTDKRHPRATVRSRTEIHESQAFAQWQRLLADDKEDSQPNEDREHFERRGRRRSGIQDARFVQQRQHVYGESPTGLPETTAEKTDATPVTRERRISLQVRINCVALLGGIAFAIVTTPTLLALQHFVCAGADYHGEPFATLGPNTCDDDTTINAAADSISRLTLIGNLSSLMSMFFLERLFRNWGLKSTITFTSLWMVLRNVVQVYGISLGGMTAAKWIEWSAALALVVGVPNFTVACEQYSQGVVPEDKHTGAFGRVRGYALLGEGFGRLAGGYGADYFGLVAILHVSSGLLVLCSLLASTALASLPRDTSPTEGKSRLASFFGGLTVFRPGLYSYSGVFFLGVASFFSLIAAGPFASAVMQIMAKQDFGFSATAVGTMAMSLSMLQGLYLIFVFNAIIKRGREWKGDAASPAKAPSPPKAIRIPAPRTESPISSDEEVGDKITSTTEPAKPSRRFDLFYLRGSVAGEVILLFLLANAFQKWHITVAFVVLAFVSATASAYRGVLVSLVLPGDDKGALAGISAIDRLASIASNWALPHSLAFFSTTGPRRAAYSFFVNTACAVVASLALVLVVPKRSPGQRVHT